MGPQARRMAAGSAHPEAGDTAGSAAGVGPFVINLCSSTTPMALSQPDAPEMKRFSFFVSRRREDNRERFRLHMGYFSTLAEAEEWLGVIRDIYPGAWAGEAPGKKLRARAAAAELANQLPSPPTNVPARVVSVSAQPVPAAPARPAAQVAQRPAAPSAANIVVPTLRPAGPAVPPPPARAVAASASVSRPAPTRVAPPPPAPRAAGAPPRQLAPAAQARPQQKSLPKKAPGVPPALSGSNVREVMAALDETGETRQMRVPPFKAPVSSAPSVPRAPTPPASAAPGVPVGRASAPKAPVSRPQAPAIEPASQAASLSDTQVLRFLEQRRDDGTDRESDEASSGISLLKPDDTQTRRALREAVIDNAPVSFAVQLYWSVSPVELSKVPPLAIFSAYTLYTVEGSREGRKWYGLRLGFFSDAISAKQVAYYVRSEFASVAVVPVSPQEKLRASAEDSKAGTGAFARPRLPEQKIEEFKLFEDEKPAAPEPAPAPKAAPAAAKPAGKAAAVPKKNKPLGKMRPREQKSVAKSLEETLEILGAGDLEIDNGRGELLNDTGVRHLRVEIQRNTPFAKLLDRLSEKIGRN
jgi:hypothetical protein